MLDLVTLGLFATQVPNDNSAGFGSRTGLSVRVFLLANSVFPDVAMLVATVDIMVKCCISLYTLLFIIIS